MKTYYGVVESRDDPKQLGRLKVRIIGLHTEDKTQLPTTDLPWATVLSHDGAQSGLGHTPSFYVEGTWVLVDFFDEDMQEPYVIGGIPGIPSSLGSTGDIGFQDPRGRPDDSSKSIYPTAAGVSDVHENARGSLLSSNATNRDTIRKISIPSADFDGFEMPTVSGTISITGSNATEFSEPLVVDDTANDETKIGTYKPTYPKNHVYSTESGHLFEFDDTDSYKRILLSHASGSYAEYSNDGTYVSHIVSDMFEVVSNNKSSLIEGDVIETIDKSLKLKVNKSDNRTNIILTSDFANFNTKTFETTFISDVKVSRKDEIITGDKLYLVFDLENESNSENLNKEQNILRMSDNVLFQKPGYTLKADILEIDMITKNLKIYMNNETQKVTGKTTLK